MSDPTVIPPWHKQFWPWFIIGLLCLSVVHGGSMLVFATMNPPGLISDDYYEVGKGINQSLDRENLAKQLQLNAKITFDNEAGVVDMRLAGFSGPEVLKLNVISPTQPEKDRRITLQKIGDGHYTGQLQDALEGRRYVELIGQEGRRDWRLFDEEVLESGSVIRLGEAK